MFDVCQFLIVSKYKKRQGWAISILYWYYDLKLNIVFDFEYGNMSYVLDFLGFKGSITVRDVVYWIYQTVLDVLLFADLVIIHNTDDDV